MKYVISLFLFVVVIVTFSQITRLTGAASISIAAASAVFAMIWSYYTLSSLFGYPSLPIKGIALWGVTNGILFFCVAYFLFANYAIAQRSVISYSSLTAGVFALGLSMDLLWRKLKQNH